MFWRNDKQSLCSCYAYSWHHVNADWNFHDGIFLVEGKHDDETVGFRSHFTYKALKQLKFGLKLHFPKEWKFPKLLFWGFEAFCERTREQKIPRLDGLQVIMLKISTLAVDLEIETTELFKRQLHKKSKTPTLYCNGSICRYFHKRKFGPLTLKSNVMNILIYSVHMWSFSVFSAFISHLQIKM